MSCVCGAERCQKGFFLSYGNQSKVGWKLLHQAAATVSTVAMKLLLLQIQLHYQQDSYSLGVHKRLEPDPVSRKHATASCVSWVGLVWCLTELQGDSCKQTRHTATQGRENEWRELTEWEDKHITRSVAGLFLPILLAVRLKKESGLTALELWPSLH